jgi:hypothetical protein
MLFSVLLWETVRGRPYWIFGVIITQSMRIRKMTRVEEENLFAVY